LILVIICRWQPAIPTGLPHEVMVDDVYNGMFIPKGSVILANARCVNHATEVRLIYALICNS
jgi:hypothetical protein